MRQPDFTEMTEAELWSDPAEADLIGAAAFHPDALAATIANLPSTDFYDGTRAIVWDAFQKLSAERKPIDPVSVSRHLHANNQFTATVRRIVTTEMSNASPAAHAVAQAEVVADLARKRELYRALKYALGIAGKHPGDASDVLAAVRAHLDQITDPAANRGEGGTRTWAQMHAEFEAAHQPGALKEGIKTPWMPMDSLIGGFFGGRLYVIGGSAGDGKSTAALNIAHYAAQAQNHVLVFSKEMPVLDVYSRIVSAPSEVELGRINRRELHELERRKVREYFEANRNLRIRVNADPVNIAGIKTISRALHHQQKLDLLVVDYLQLIDTASARSQEEEIAKVSTALKQLAMELDIPLIVPAQLNRNPNARPDTRPTKADLRGSGRIEQDADVVVLLWHKLEGGHRTGRVTFIVDKNRHGPRGEFELDFNGGYGEIA